MRDAWKRLSRVLYKFFWADESLNQFNVQLLITIVSYVIVFVYAWMLDKHSGRADFLEHFQSFIESSFSTTITLILSMIACICISPNNNQKITLFSVFLLVLYILGGLVLSYEMTLLGFILTFFLTVSVVFLELRIIYVLDSVSRNILSA